MNFNKLRKTKTILNSFSFSENRIIRKWCWQSESDRKWPMTEVKRNLSLWQDHRVDTVTKCDVINLTSSIISARSISDHIKAFAVTVRRFFLRRPTSCMTSWMARDLWPRPLSVAHACCDINSARVIRTMGRSGCNVMQLFSVGLSVALSSCLLTWNDGNTTADEMCVWTEWWGRQRRLYMLGNARERIQIP